TKVLDLRPKGLPEIVFSKSGNERLIFTHSDGGAFSDVYLWRGTGYEARIRVPRERRLENLE
ncbi:MAG: hypothetical protein NTZ61_00140, partial [Proteobacteria bacterium]|nr:hypothetical protein [Pseudomonadota bacterium]